ncbi:MAG: YqhA family protein [Flavobacteriales bacterium]|nr:YqhA family protein [Flavobacteriales bacterium]
MQNDKLNKQTDIKNIEDQSLIERVFEKVLWSTRYTVILAVIFSVLGSVSLFMLGSYEIMVTLFSKLPNLLMGKTHDHSELLYKLITAVDLYLIGVVLLIFGFGIYELFISKIDIARRDETVTILEIENLEELKNKIIKVIIMVLIVSFFERILKISSSFTTPIDMAYFALSILGLSLGVYFIRKHS